MKHQTVLTMKQLPEKDQMFFLFVLPKKMHQLVKFFICSADLKNAKEKHKKMDFGSPVNVILSGQNLNLIDGTRKKGEGAGSSVRAQAHTM